jgi:hypothetical protein
MSDKLNPVYVHNNPEDGFVEIQPEYVYMTIPAEYVCIYHRILVMLTDFGIDLLKDCQAACSSKNRKIIDCFNMFNAAVAARKLNQFKLAKTLIEYIKGQIDLNYNGKSPCPEVVFPVDEEGKINALVGCGNKPKFTVDAATGKLWMEHQGELNSVYSLGEEDFNGVTNDNDDNPSTGE